MALRAVLEKEKYDGLSDDMKEHYTKKDEKYFLDVTKVDGLGVEDIGGLKSTLENLRTVEKGLRADAKTSEEAMKAVKKQMENLQGQFKDIDPVAAKDALNKIDDIKNWDGEKKVREAVQVAEQNVTTRMQTKLDEVVKQNTTTVTGLKTELEDSQGQLQEAVVTTKIVEAISKENGNVDVLMPHVRNQVIMTKDSHGKFRPEVIKADGTPRIGDSAGNDMTITQLVQEMKTQDTFAGCFSGANQTGSGKTGTSESGTQKKIGEGKIVAASDTKAVSNSLEDIASGKTKVDMSQ